MIILGISAFYHDSAACIVQDGQIVAAAQEERFSRRKHDAEFPQCAVNFCLREAGCQVADLDFVAFYDKPLLKFDRLLETYLAVAPLGLQSFAKAMPVWIRKKLHLPREIQRKLGHKFRGPLIFTEHHEAHAASAFLPSPFDEAAILTLDGVGEWTTGSLGVGRGNRIKLSHQIPFPHSLGLLYSAFTDFCGFKVNSGEYKLMGLAPYGEARFKDLILRELIDLKPDGSFRLNLHYFNYCQGLAMTGKRFARLFRGPPRMPEAPLTEREFDLAASIQAVTEEVILRCARHLRQQTGLRNLTLAGGVALNCAANGKIAREEIFDAIWIQPAAGDAGGSLGAALFTWHQLLDMPRVADGRRDGQRGSLLGPRFDRAEIESFLEGRAKYEVFDSESNLLDRITDEIIAGRIVGFFQGRMEFGPRALGCRSILADARRPEMQSILNWKTKFRESFRPFAPSVLVEFAQEWFELCGLEESPYMMFTSPLRDAKRLPVATAARGLDRLKTPGSVVPAITHVDSSARVQTVDEGRHGRFYRLLRRFYDKTGCPLLVNTSFNVRGEPIVCSPEQAYRCFMATQIDVLVLEDCLLDKNDQPTASKSELKSYLASHELD